MPISNDARLMSMGFKMIPSSFFEPILPLIDIQSSEEESDTENDEKLNVKPKLWNFLCNRSVVSDTFLYIDQEEDDERKNKNCKKRK